MHIKKAILFISLFLISISSFYASDNEGYKIKFKVNGLKDTVAYLANHFGNKQYIQDTARIDANGVCVFENKTKLTGGVYIFYCPATRGKTFDFIVTENQNFTFELDTLDYYKYAKINCKGHCETQDWLEYIRFFSKKTEEISPLRDTLEKAGKNSSLFKETNYKISKINIEVADYKLNYITKYPTSFIAKWFNAMEEPKIPEQERKASKDSLFAYKYYKSHFFDSVDFSDERLLKCPIFHSKIDYYITKLNSPTPDSLIACADYLIGKAKVNKEVFKYITWYLTYTYETSAIMGYDAIYVHIIDKYYKTNQAYWLDSAKLSKFIKKADDTRPLLLGKKAPDQIMQDSLGNYITLYSVKADYLVVVFWDPDCGHCKKELPKLRDFYANFKNKTDLKIFGVCTDMENPKWKKLVQDEHYDWINVIDPYGQRKLYDVQSTPLIYLLNKNKMIIAKKLGADQLGDFINHEIK